MQLQQQVMDSYILLQARWPRELARDLVRQSTATHVIIYRTEPDLYLLAEKAATNPGAGQPAPGEVKEYYYLFPMDEARHRLEDYTWEPLVYGTFALHEWSATPNVSPAADASQVPAQVVVTDEGRLVGFYDRALAPPDTARENPFESAEEEPRLLSATFPNQVPLGQWRSLVVNLAELGATLDDFPGAAPANVAVGASLTLVVQPLRGFDVLGPDEATFTVTAAETIKQFMLRAVEVGPGKVRVLAFVGGQTVTAITLKPTVVAADQPVGPEASTASQPVDDLNVVAPDLALRIFERTRDGKVELTFRLAGRDPSLAWSQPVYGPVTIERSASDYFRTFFDDIEDLPLQTPEDRQVAQLQLASKGGELFKKFVPPALQQELWAKRDRIRSVQVLSDEPWVPWELCMLSGQDDQGKKLPGLYFCEAFEITRWLMECKQTCELHMKNAALIIPKNSGLPYAAEERDYMLSLDKAPARKVTRVPATFLSVWQAFTAGTYDAWHFTGHGGASSTDPNSNAILLEDKRVFTPRNLNGGDVANVGLTRPLVFLNACQIGRGDMSITGIGGWAAEFVRCGAGAFIGAYWSIYDRPAVDFAKAFYSRLLAGATIGQAAKEARLAIKDSGSPTWLAYTVWANPAAKVVG